jgi:hypothetical protein
MSLVSVWTDVGGRKPVPLIAKIIEKDGVIFTIRYLSESDDKIWRYEEETYDIDDDSIAEYFKTDREEDIGFTPCGSDGFIKGDSDEDYEPSDEEGVSEEESDEECETEEEETMVTEDEDEDTEDEEEYEDE